LQFLFTVFPRADSRGFRVLPLSRVRCHQAMLSSSVRLAPTAEALSLKARFPLVLSPFRVFHVYRVGGCYQLPPLLSFAPGLFSFGRDFSGLFHCLRVFIAILRWFRTFTLLGVAALQGVLPFLSFLVLPPNPLCRVCHASGFALKTGRHLHLLPCGNDRRLLALAMGVLSCD